MQQRFGLVVACVLSFLVLWPAGVFGNQNLLKNGSFDAGLDGWGTYVFTGTPRIAVEEGVLVIEGSTADRVTVNQWVEGFVPGGVYELTARIKTDGPFQGERRTGPSDRCGCGFIRIQFKDEKNQHARSLVHTPVVYNEADWAHISATFDVPVHTAAVQVEIFFEYAGGTFLVDDVRFVPAGTASAGAPAASGPAETTVERPAAVPPAPAVDHTGNLVSNPSFASGLDGWKVYRFSGQPVVSADGAGVQIFTHDNTERVTVYQDVRGFEPGVPHELSAMVRTEGTTSGRGAYIRLQFKDAQGKNTRGHLETRSILKTDGWTELTADVAIPEGTEHIVLELFMEHAAGTVWFTNVRLRESRTPVLNPTEFTAETSLLGAVHLSWQVDGAERLPDGAVSYQVHRSFAPGTPTVPLAIVTGTEFVDRTVRPGRTYYYSVVPVVSGPFETESSTVLQVTTGDLPPGLPPERIEAVWTAEGTELTWTYTEGARINHLDLYRYVGAAPDDLEAALAVSSFVARVPAWQTRYLDTAVNEEEADRTWYIVRAQDPDQNIVGLDAVPVTGLIRSVPVIHNFEHPYLIVTGKELAALREAAGDNVGLRQVISFSLLRAADGDAVLWASPRELPAKDANSDHAQLARTARNLGLAYQLQPEREQYAKAARNILLAYADHYKTYPKLTTYGGRVTFQTLNESGWLIDIAWAYDLIYSFLTPEERKHIEQDLILAAADVIRSSPRGLINWQVWHNAGLAAAGFVTRNRELIDEVLFGEMSVLYHLKEGLLADGLWWEQSIAYHEYTLEAFTWLALIAQNGGYDIFGLQVGDRTFRSMYDAIVYHAFTDLGQPSVGDSPADFTLRSMWLYGVAYKQYGDPKFAWVLRQGNILGGGFPGVLLTYWTLGAESVAPTVGSTDFAPAGRNDYGSSLFGHTGLAILRGSVASGDGINAAVLWKPMGTIAGHQHADNLSLYLTAHGHQWLAGSGRFSYLPGLTDDRHGTYARHTVAKNTLVVDGVSQVPQTLSGGLWNTDGAQTSRGRLLTYVPGPTMQLVRAGTDEAYPGVKLIRTLLVTDAYVLDVFDAASGVERQYDWVIHVDGELAEVAASFVPVRMPLGDEDGSQYVEIRHKLDGVLQPLVTRWTRGKGHLDHWLLPVEPIDAVLLGTSLWTVAPNERSVYVARTKGQTARFVSVFAPGAGEPAVHEVSWQNADRTMLRVVHGKGVDVIVLPAAGEQGPVQVIRKGEAGTVTDFMLAGGTELVWESGSVAGGAPTSLSAGLVDGVWVVHHEGPVATELKLSGLGAAAVSLRDERRGRVESVAVRETEDGLAFHAQRRGTYVLADVETARTLPLAVELGSVK